MDDLISRQQAIDAVNKLVEWYKEKWHESRPTSESVIDVLNNLPSAQPVKKGKWIKISHANIYECSECGKNVMTDDISAYDFCHGCGADMRGESDETD